MKKQTKKADIWLLAALAVVGLVLALVLLLTRRGGAVVQVRVAGEVVETFSLSDETEYEITGAGGGTNLLVIRDGAAWIEEADCPDELCRRMGKVRLAGQSVVCLPHQVVVEIVGAEEANAPDVFVG